MRPERLFTNRSTKTPDADPARNGKDVVKTTIRSGVASSKDESRLCSRNAHRCARMVKPKPTVHRWQGQRSVSAMPRPELSANSRRHPASNRQGCVSDRGAAVANGPTPSYRARRPGESPGHPQRPPKRSPQPAQKKRRSSEKVPGPISRITKHTAARLIVYSAPGGSLVIR